jgi:hypothetical protein
MATTPDNAGLTPLLAGTAGVAALIDKSVRSVRRMNSAGLLPSPVRCGGSPKWRIEEIKSWVDAGCPTRARWEKMHKSQ